MGFLVGGLFATLVSICAAQAPSAPLLFPQPTSVELGSTSYELDSSFTITWVGTGPVPSILSSAFQRYQSLILYRADHAAARASGSALSSLDVSAMHDVVLGPDTDESYSLTISDDGASLVAKTTVGAIRGLETFSQLVQASSPFSGTYNVPAITIKDTPRFSFRSYMIDSSRHFLSLDTIFAHLDAMAYSKFNVLHWHIVDSQSFPYPSDAFPELEAKGEYDAADAYSDEDIQKVIAFAAARGIRVIPEFDTPGHTAAWGLGQPDLLTKCSKSISSTGSYAVNPVLDSTWVFLKAFFTEVAKKFPDAYIHLGGDEVSFDCWANNTGIQNFMKKTFPADPTNLSQLEEYYEAKLLDLVGGLGKSYIIWQDVIDNNVTVKSNTVVDVWRGGYQAEMAKVTAQGYHVVLSAPWYLNYLSDPYGDPWEKFYVVDPQDFDGTPAQKAMVIGGEVTMWAEYVDNTNAVSRTWPRASVVGERFWSPADVNDPSAAIPRIQAHRCRLVRRGIAAEPIAGPSFCDPEFDFVYSPSYNQHVHVDSRDTR